MNLYKFAINKLVLCNKFIYKRSPFKRKIILVIFDVLIINLSIIASSYITNTSSNSHNYLNLLFFTFTSVLIYILTGQYKPLNRYLSSISFYKIALRNVLFLVTFIIISNLVNYEITIESLIALFILLTSLSTYLRILLRDLATGLITFENDKDKKYIIIYGAGEAGTKLLTSLQLTNKYFVRCFIDDNRSLWGREINEIPIYSPQRIIYFKDKIDQILIAIPSATKKRRLEIIEKIKKYDIPIYQTPSIEELALGKNKINSLTPIQSEDLLQRDIANLNPKKNFSYFNSKVICVTGAAGSIGSEICRQLITLNPKILILIDKNEHSLYLINQELQQKTNNRTEILPKLINVKEEASLEDIFKEYKINIIFHAAAYKHVPLVEINPLEGIENNVFASYNICKFANIYKVDKLLLISSDKAVRPTNVMGVTKRISEIIFQSFSDKSQKTSFSIVRFGNVLGSSGSVVPLFKKQIAEGGPITITDPKVIRYFMTISEAAKLVIESLTLSKSGEIFLLDMGEPVQIIDLAKQMIKLSGLTLKDKKNKDGDIEIKTIGLRAGEKIYEELLINGKSKSTKNPLIFQADEKPINSNDLWNKLADLKKLLQSREKKRTMDLISDLIPEWEQSSYIKKK